MTDRRHQPRRTRKFSGTGPVAEEVAQQRFDGYGALCKHGLEGPFMLVVHGREAMPANVPPVKPH